MRAVCWLRPGRVQVDSVPDPVILNPHDAIVRVTSTAICGSDLHLYNGSVPGMRPGDILGHEFMGEVVEVGKAVRTLKKGDRVVVPCTIACGGCFFCKRQDWALCDNSNPNAALAEKHYGHAPAGLFGFSQLFGGYAGGQAEYVRVPFADVGPLPVPPDLPDEKVLFLSDVFPAGYVAAESCNLQAGDTVAVWGCGPVGLLAIRSARLLGAARVIAIDRFEDRLARARDACGAEVLNYQEVDVLTALRDLTGGRGPDACIDAVGMEGHGVSGRLGLARQRVHRSSDRPTVLSQAIQACRKGGTVSVSGWYAGARDSVPVGAAFAKGLTLKLGQTPVQRCMRPLLERIQRGEIDPSFIITHRLSLEQAPWAYRNFRDKHDHCLKVVMKPRHTAALPAATTRQSVGVRMSSN